MAKPQTPRPNPAKPIGQPPPRIDKPVIGPRFGTPKPKGQS